MLTVISYAWPDVNEKSIAHMKRFDLAGSPVFFGMVRPGCGCTSV